MGRSLASATSNCRWDRTFELRLHLGRSIHAHHARAGIGNLRCQMACPHPRSKMRSSFGGPAAAPDRAVLPTNACFASYKFAFHSDWISSMVHSFLAHGFPSPPLLRALQIILRRNAPNAYCAAASAAQTAVPCGRMFIPSAASGNRTLSDDEFRVGPPLGANRNRQIPITESSPLGARAREIRRIGFAPGTSRSKKRTATFPCGTRPAA